MGDEGDAESGAEATESGVNWWSWRELNPRPQAFYEQFYMFSGLFWFSPPPSRSRTLRKQPVPYFLAPDQGTRSEASPCNYPCS